MTPYERNIFDGKCPYTNKFCHKDIACANCEVNAEERYFEEEFDRSDDKKALSELKEALKADKSWIWFLSGCWIGMALGGVCVYFFG
jgi:hypothetical protein